MNHEARDLAPSLAASAFAAAADNPHYGLWVLDAQDRTSFANQTLLHMLGAEDLVGTDALELFADGERARVEERTALQALGVSEEFDTHLRDAQGYPVPVRLSLSPRFEADGRYAGSAAIVRDLRGVEVQPATPEPATVPPAPVQASLVHTLNTALQSLLGQAGQLAGAVELPTELSEATAELQRTAVRCSELVSRLLVPALATSDPATACALLPTVEATLGGYRAYLAASNARVTLAAGNGTVSAWAPRALVERILAEALGLVADALVDHGGGTLHVEVTAQGPLAVLSLRLVGAEARLSSGRLASLLELVGGSLDVREHEGEGVTLRVCLPAALPGADHETAPVIAADDSPARLLVIDDEAFILELNREALEPLGDVVTASSADEAVGLLETGAYDLVISDLRMPGALDGMGLYRWATRHRPNQAERMVFTTADTLSTQASTFLLSAGRPYIAKPYSIRDYRAFISTQLAACAMSA